jgi:hypothetical protein
MQLFTQIREGEYRKVKKEGVALWNVCCLLQSIR